MGTKARPFYRVVVAKAMSGRDSADVEILGVYNPILKVKLLEINQERALHWLLEGAQPTETVGYLLKKCGVLEKFFEARPKSRTKFKYLDKSTAVMNRASVIETSTTEKVAKEAPVAVAEPVTQPVVETPTEIVAEVTTEAPAETTEA